MADQHHITERGNVKIGRQIVLPLSKAFEIAWKSIKIRIWRSLITMTGIILAIAFLVSVWTSGSVSSALESVTEDDANYPLVRRALRERALAGEKVSISVAVVGGQPVQSICDSLREKREFQPFEPGILKEFKTVLSDKGASEATPDAVVLLSLPAGIADSEGVRAIEAFVNNGGMLIVFGYEQLWPEGAGDVAKKEFDELLPARPTQEKIEAKAGAIKPMKHEAAADAAWKGHPATVFVKAKPKAEAEALASVGKDGIAWLGQHGDGTVIWYPVAGRGDAQVKPLTWLRDSNLLVGSLRWGARAKLRAGSVNKRNVWLVFLSLLVCVVGITNAMLMSVTERFREIGTMKCLGALDKFVVRLFLIESSMQGAVGSLVGVGVGFVLAFVRALFAYRVTDPATEQTHWLTLGYFPWLTVLIWVAVAVIVGMALSVVAAIYPAYRAARMEPVEAMRSEA